MKRLIHPAIAVLIVVIFTLLEGALYPVIRLWSAKSVSIIRSAEGSTMYVSGAMHKVRGCKFLAMEAESESGAHLTVTYFDSHADPAKARPTGAQEWGPWSVNLEPATQTVEVYSVHDCHPLWTTRTFLGEVLVTP